MHHFEIGRALRIKGWVQGSSRQRQCHHRSSKLKTLEPWRYAAIIFWRL